MMPSGRVCGGLESEHEPTPEHLTREVSSRGLSYLPDISGTSGYTMQALPDGSPDFDGPMTPRDHGKVRVHESSEAMYPAIWLRVEDGDGKDAVLHLSLERAEHLRDQLDWLVQNHYQVR
jgi:hypothetical protein